MLFSPLLTGMQQIARLKEELGVYHDTDENKKPEVVLRKLLDPEMLRKLADISTVESSRIEAERAYLDMWARVQARAPISWWNDVLMELRLDALQGFSLAVLTQMQLWCNKLRPTLLFGTGLFVLAAASLSWVLQATEMCHQVLSDMFPVLQSPEVWSSTMHIVSGVASYALADLITGLSVCFLPHTNPSPKSKPANDQEQTDTEESAQGDAASMLCWDPLGAWICGASAHVTAHPCCVTEGCEQACLRFVHYVPQMCNLGGSILKNFLFRVLRWLGMKRLANRLQTWWDMDDKTYKVRKAPGGMPTASEKDQPQSCCTAAQLQALEEMSPIEPKRAKALAAMPPQQRAATLAAMSSSPKQILRGLQRLACCNALHIGLLASCVYLHSTFGYAVIRDVYITYSAILFIRYLR